MTMMMNISARTSAPTTVAGIIIIDIGSPAFDTVAVYITSFNLYNCKDDA